MYTQRELRVIENALDKFIDALDRAVITLNGISPNANVALRQDFNEAIAVRQRTKDFLLNGEFEDAEQTLGRVRITLKLRDGYLHKTPTQQNRIQAIKAIRNATGEGLIASKNLIDAVARGNSIDLSVPGKALTTLIVDLSSTAFYYEV